MPLSSFSWVTVRPFLQPAGSLCPHSPPYVAAQLSARRNKGISQSMFFIKSLNYKQRYSNITENGVNPPACTQCNRHIPLYLFLPSAPLLTDSLQFFTTG